MNGLAHRTIKNSTYSFFSFIWSLMLSFLTVPFIVKGLGPSNYGLYTLLNTSLTIFLLLDFGLSYHFTKKLSEDPEHIDSGNLSSIFSTTFFSYLIIGLIVFFSLVLMQNYFLKTFKLPITSSTSIGLFFLVIGTTFLFSMITQPFYQVAYALQRVDLLAKVGMINISCVQIVSVIVVLKGHGVLALLVIQSLSSLFVFLIYLYLWRKLLPTLNLKFYFSLKHFKDITKNGFWVFLNNTLGNILTQFDKLVLGIYWGPSAVGFYSSSQTIPSKIQATASSLSLSFFPVFSMTSFSEQKYKTKMIFRRTMRIIPVITAGLTIVAIVFSYPLMKFWINTEFADNTYIAIRYLAVTYFFLAMGSFFNSFLNGLKKLKFAAFCTLILAFSDIIFMLIFIPHYKVNGAAFAYLLSSLPVLFFLFYIEKKYLGSNTQEIVLYYGKIFLKLGAAGLLVYLVANRFYIKLATNLIYTVTIGVITFLSFLLIYWVFGFFEEEDLSLFKSYIKKQIFLINNSDYANYK